jgi:hypothetical protein
VDVLGGIADIVNNPLDHEPLAAALSAAIAGGPRRELGPRDSLRLPDPKEWFDAVAAIHGAVARRRRSSWAEVGVTP